MRALLVLLLCAACDRGPLDYCNPHWLPARDCPRKYELRCVDRHTDGRLIRNWSCVEVDQ